MVRLRELARSVRWLGRVSSISRWVSGDIGASGILYGAERREFEKSLRQIGIAPMITRFCLLGGHYGSVWRGTGRGGGGYNAWRTMGRGRARFLKTKVEDEQMGAVERHRFGKSENGQLTTSQRDVQAAVLRVCCAWPSLVTFVLEDTWDCSIGIV